MSVIAVPNTHFPPDESALGLAKTVVRSLSEVNAELVGDVAGTEVDDPERAARRLEAASYVSTETGSSMSRFWILPVAPFGSASVSHTTRGYL